MDKILIKDLLLRCSIGVSTEERREKEDVLINIELSVDLAKPCKTDELNDTVNYRDVKKRIIHLVESSQYNLIESMAEKIAFLCLETKGVLEANVIVEKPSALRFARSVGVQISRKRSDIRAVSAFIGIGSNIDPEENIFKALSLLETQVQIVNLSTLYRTEPLGHPNDPPFVNGIIEIRTPLTPEALKYNVLRPIESQLGRQRAEDKNAPRTIDLDVLLYGDLAIKRDDLTVPDPQIRERNFLMIPLSELAPNLVPPGWGASLFDCAKVSNLRPMKPLNELTDRLRKMVHK